MTSSTHPRPRRPHRWAGPAAWLLAATLVPVAAATATVDVPAAEAATGPSANFCSQVPPTDGSTGQPVTKSYDPTADPLLLPAWGDSGGWNNDSSYQTIMSADIDDDGWGDLIGRNGNMLDVYTPAPPSRQWDAPPFSETSAQGNDILRPPYKEQWVPKAVVTPPATADPFTTAGSVPTFNEGTTTAVLATDYETPAAVPGFSDPSRYTTFRIADLDGPSVPGKQLLVRAPVFGPAPPDGTAHPYGNSKWPYVPTYQGTSVLVYSFVNGQWVQQVPSPIVSGGPVWPDVTGKKYGPQGNAKANDTISDPFFLPQYYQSITVGDVEGDGTDDLIGRGSQGIQVWSWDPSSNSFGSWAGFGSGNLEDGGGLGMDESPEYWSTIRVADFIPDPDHKKDLLARTKNGVQLLEFVPPPFGSPGNAPWSWQARATITDAIFTGSSDPGTAYYANEKSTGKLTFNESVPTNVASTIRVADLDGNGSDEVLAMNANGQLQAYTFDGSGNGSAFFSGPQQMPEPVGFANVTANVGSDPMYYATLQGGDVVGGSAQEVLIRASDGLHVFQLHGPGIGSYTLSDDPGLLQPQMSDDNGWTDPSKYLTIQVVQWASSDNAMFGGVPQAPRNALIGRDATGIRTYWVNPLAPTATWTSPSAGFPGWAGGNDPTAHDDSTPTSLATPWGKTYGYLNDQVAKIMNWGPPTYPGNATTPVYPTIRSKFSTAAGITNWADIATLVSIQPPPPDSYNISREDFEAVKLQLADWIRDWDTLLQFFFSSTTGLQQLLTNGLLVGDLGFPISVIEAQFSPSSSARLWTVIGDLLWGLAAGLAPEWVAAVLPEELGTKLLTDGGKRGFALAMNMMGAGIGAGLTYADHSKRKQGVVDVEAAQLDNTLAAMLCGASAFMYGSADLAATNLGLLQAMGQTIRATPTDLEQYSAMVGTLARQRTIWAYQQFASMNPTKDTGWQESWWTSSVYVQIDPSKDDPSKLAPGQVLSGPNQYQPVGKDCGDTKRPSDAMATLTQTLGVDPGDLAGPTYAYWDENHPPSVPEVIYGGLVNQPAPSVGMPLFAPLDPIPDGMSSSTLGIGVNGWRLPLALCNSSA